MRLKQLHCWQVSLLTLKALHLEQVQERLTNQIAEDLKQILGTEDVAVILDAKHLCVSSRGIKDESSATVTSYYGGKFGTPEKIAELQNYLKD